MNKPRLYGHGNTLASLREMLKNPGGGDMQTAYEALPALLDRIDELRKAGASAVSSAFSLHSMPSGGMGDNSSYEYESLRRASDVISEDLDPPRRKP